MMLLDLLFPALDLDPLVRVAGAFATALGVAVVAGMPVVRFLRARKLRDGACRKASETLAQLHAEAGKAATPTMGGLIIVLGLLAGVLLWVPLGAAPVLLVGLGLVLAFAAIGAVDDWAKLTNKGTDGLKGRSKLLAEVALATVALLALAALAEVRTDLVVPVAGVTLHLGAWYLPFAALVIVGTANAANLTDGLDGLASGVVGVAATALALCALLLAGLLGAAVLFATAATVAVAEHAVFAAALAGACFGFLWHNRFPARVFMGDTGSLAIGAGLGFAAVLLRLEALLLIVGGVLVLEALSVILQVASFKLTGKRIFRCAPIHHHFQFKGWTERKVVTRFWLAGFVLAVLGVASHFVVLA